MLHPLPLSSDCWGGRKSRPSHSGFTIFISPPMSSPTSPPSSPHPHLPNFLFFPFMLFFFFSFSHSTPFPSSPHLSSSLRRGWSHSHLLGTEWPEWRRLSLPAFSPWTQTPFPLSKFFCFVLLVHIYFSLRIETSPMIRWSFCHSKSCNLCLFQQVLSQICICCSYFIYCVALLTSVMSQTFSLVCGPKQVN